MHIFLVALGAAVGGIVRYFVSSALTRRWGEKFPWGTLAVNLLGSSLLGLILGASSRGLFDAFPAGAAEALLGIGFCGGLTTFSAFSFQTLNLVSRQQWRGVAVNLGASLALCMVAVWAGYRLGERWPG